MNRIFSLARGVTGKIIAGFVGTLMLLALIGGLGIYGLSKTDDMFRAFYSQNVIAMRDLSTVTEEMGRVYSRVLKTQIDDGRRGARVDTLEQFWDESKVTVKGKLDGYYPAKISTPAERRTAKRMVADYDDMSSRMDRYIRMLQAGDIAGAERFYDQQISGLFERVRENVRELYGTQVAQARDRVESAKASISGYSRWMIGVVVLAVILVPILIAWLVRAISRPMRYASHLIEAIGDGRLDNQIDNPYRDGFGVMLDELGEMQNHLRKTVSEVRQSSDSVASSTREISAGNDELSSRTQQQAASLEQTSSATEEMTSTVRQNADNAAQADRLAREVGDKASEGGQIVEKAIQAMKDIDESSSRISDIIGMVDDIAFQTNLLALNASVEAARAGEHGRGFAVVATEVRKLASRSAESAKEIKTLVEDSEGKVSYGSSQVASTGEKLGEIEDSVTKVKDLISELASASKEQSVGIEQINTAIQEMDSVTQQNAALVEQSSAASHALMDQAETLKSRMAYFRIGNDEFADHMQPPRTPQSGAESASATSATRNLSGGAKATGARPGAAQNPSRPSAEPSQTDSNSQGAHQAQEDDDDWTAF